MSVPYAKNMAVEFADKTIKGKNIDDEFESTDSTIETIQSDIQALEQTLNGKVVFDGELVVDITGGYKPTLTADNLAYLYENHNKGGVFKLKNSNGYYEGILSYNSLQMQDDDYVFAAGMWIYGDLYKKLELSSAPLVLWELPSIIKPIYWHTINFARGSGQYAFTFVGHMVIINNSPTPITLTDFLEIIKTPGFVGLVINGKCAQNAAGTLTNLTDTLLRLEYKNAEACDAYYYSGGDATELTLANVALVPASFIYFNDLGANRIN